MTDALATDLHQFIAERFGASIGLPRQFFAAQADPLAEACLAMARRFHRGGRLLAMGRGALASDAQHVVVEFVHPVITGKRALPAIVLDGNASGSVGGLRSELQAVAGPHDIVVGFIEGGDADVESALAAARERDLLTIAFTANTDHDAAAREQANYCFAAGSNDPLVNQEIYETAYHVLWELVHVFFAHRALLDDPPADAPVADEAGMADQGWLYPFLARERPGGAAAPLGEVRQSIGLKCHEIVSLRQQVLDTEADTLVQAGRTIADAFTAGRRLWIFGNGGSATDAADLASDFRSPPLPRHRALPALALSSDAATITAVANDVGFENIFARQLIAFAQRDDVAIGISTSGNSRNLVAAFQTAHRMGLRSIALSGDDGGRVAQLARAGIIGHLFVVPSAHIPRIQEAQATIYHTLYHLVHRLMEG
ncbi:MAG: SIS domain-containing protein [Phycisphaeraceae bacterium]